MDIRSSEHASVPLHEQLDLTDSSFHLTDKIVDQDLVKKRNNIQANSNHPPHQSRRKRLHMLSTPNFVDIPNQTSTTINDFNNIATIELLDVDNEAFDCNDELSLHQTSSDSTVLSSLDALKLTKLDPEFRGLISRYVRSEHIVRCLELGGFCTPYVLVSLDELQLQRLEEFVGHACSLMKSITLREYFTGPIFAHDPSQFKLPSGAVCGILLAVNEIRKRYRRYQTISGASETDMNMTIAMQNSNDIACQTEHLSPTSSVNQNLSSITCESFSSGNDIVFLNSPSTTVCNSASVTNVTRLSESYRISESFCPPYKHDTSNTTIVVSNGTILTGDSIVSANEPAFTQSNNNNYNNDSITSAIVSFASDQIVGIQSGSNCIANSRLNIPGGTNLNLSTLQPFPVSNQNSSILNVPTSIACGNGAFEEEVVDLERLKQHSSSSAIRLASRQFVNARLIRGRDFDMEMELSITSDGFKRVTGIFYCHLCREKRERTSAVRFSIARNRYPVLSNVLSHLKTHFLYRGQAIIGSQANAVLQQTNNILKSANESYMNYNRSGSTGPHLGIAYRSDPNVDNSVTNSTSISSFLSPSFAVNQFSSQIKSEPTTFSFSIDNEGAEDSSTEHTIFDNLSTSPSNSHLNSPKRKTLSPHDLNHSSRRLGIEHNGSSHPDSSNPTNSINTLTS